MDLGLKDKVALVAASSKGLGKAAAFGLAREGTKLVICARDKDVLEQTADEIFLETGVTVFPLAVDLTDPKGIDWLFTETLDLFGKVDILVTNAGGPPAGTFDETDEESWHRAFQLTMMSAVRMTRAALPMMRKQQWGRIVHVASVTAKQPILNLHLSNVMRPGIIGFTKSLALEMAAENVLINAVCPGYIMTDRVKELIDDRAKREKKSFGAIQKAMSSEIPIGRPGNPEEFANLVVFLASERASYITGSLFQVDGGFVRGL